MFKILAFGHQNPDSNVIGSSVIYAYLKRELGVDVEAVALGTPSKEITFTLNYFGVEAPCVIGSARAEGTDQVILTDHSESQQLISGVRNVEVIEVADHHRVANSGTANPLYMRLEPVGSAPSIVCHLRKENSVTIPKEMAGLLSSGLISDTPLLKSPTIHAIDSTAAVDLTETAGVNLEECGLVLLKADTDLATKSVRELIDIDAKTFELDGDQVRVAQVNTVDINEVLERQAEIEAAITVANTANSYSNFIFMIIDTLSSNSETLALGSDIDKVEAAFSFKLENNRVFLAGAVPCKKQITP